LNISGDVIQWTADSGWIAITAQVGIFGVLAWWIYFFGLYRQMRRFSRQNPDTQYSWLATGMLGIVIATFVSIFSVHYLTYRAVSLYFWIWAALTFKAFEIFQQTDQQTGLPQGT
jgi:hypothetical protein